MNKQKAEARLRQVRKLNDNRRRDRLFKAADLGETAAAQGVNIAKKITQASVVTIATGAVTGAAPIALVSAGVILAAVDAILAYRAMKKSRELVAQTMEIMKNSDNYSCPCAASDEHQHLANWASVYATVQMTKRHDRNKHKLKPVVGTPYVISIKIAHSIKKRYKGTRGQDRQEVANALVDHHFALGGQCDLATAILGTILADYDETDLREALELDSDHLTRFKSLVFNKLSSN